MEQKRKDELEELVARVRGGEEEAITPLVDMLGGPVFSFLRKQGIPPTELPDVIAEFLESLLDVRMDDYQARKGSSFWNWLCAVMANEAKDWHRRRRRVPETPDSEYIDRTAANLLLVDDDIIPPSPERLMLIESLRDAFARLSADEQDLLRLKIVAGLTYEQIAAQSPTGAGPVSKKTLTRLRVRLLRAEQKIRIWMAADSRVPKLNGDIRWKKAGSFR